MNRQNLSKHLVILDSALDAYHKELLFKKREQGTLAGVTIATDESPPKQPRFGGLRFQITLLYVGTYKSLAEWELLDDPPITRTSVLGDIMHCAGKKGKDVWGILEKQLLRLGLSTHDVVAGVGDGGGRTRARLASTTRSRRRTVGMSEGGASHTSLGEQQTKPSTMRSLSLSLRLELQGDHHLPQRGDHLDKAEGHRSEEEGRWWAGPHEGR